MTCAMLPVSKIALTERVLWKNGIEAALQGSFRCSLRITFLVFHSKRGQIRVMKTSSSNRRAISLSKGGGPNNEVIAVQPEPGVAFSVGALRFPSVRG